MVVRGSLFHKILINWLRSRSRVSQLVHNGFQILFLNDDILLRDKGQLSYLFLLGCCDDLMSPIMNLLNLLIDLANLSAIPKILCNEVHILDCLAFNFVQFSKISQKERIDLFFLAICVILKLLYYLFDLLCLLLEVF